MCLFPKHGLALAPMRAITQPPFWKILNHYGQPDAYFTEFVRVHENFLIDETWIENVLDSAQGCPVWVQLMGNDITAFEKNIRILEHYPIAGIDFNAGCPIPKIFKKQAGGGLLRDLPLLRELLLAIKSISRKPLSVKFRIGFNSADHFDEILAILSEVHPDLVTLHARTVSDLYKALPRYEYITKAVHQLPCPVLANGSIDSLNDIDSIFLSTQCHGAMLGRAIIRNPWLFKQWRNILNNEPIIYPTFEAVLQYLRDLFTAFTLDQKAETTALGCLKRFTNYIGLAVDNEGIFLTHIRTAQTLKAFWNVCQQFLDNDNPYVGNAFPNLFAQPNKETSSGETTQSA